MALWYVDNTAAGANDGTSWTDAWTSGSAITGLSAGDTVYISGGTSGKTYTWPVNWVPTSGSLGSPVTYAVGQDTGHTGMVTFTKSASAGANAFFATNTVQHVTINGEVNGQRRMTIDNTYSVVLYNANATAGDKYIKLLYAEWDGPCIFTYGGYYEIAYCSGIAPLSYTDDSFIAHIGDGSSATQGVGISSIHDNYFQVAKVSATGNGFDLFKWVVNTDIYRNILISVVNASYAGGQHQDGIQSSVSSLRIWSNYFEGFSNAPIFIGTFGGDSAGLRIYNNVFNANDAASVLIEVGSNGIGTGTISDVIIANNTLIGNGGASRGIFFGVNSPNNFTIGADVYIINNIVYDCLSGETVVIQAPGSPTVSNNAGGTSGLAFIANTAYPNHNFRLTAGATAAIDAGIRPAYVTNAYTSDADGLTRNGTWDLGAYEYSNSSSSSACIVGRRLRWM